MACLQLRFSRALWAVWVGASWDGAPVFNSCHGAQCNNTLFSFIAVHITPDVNCLVGRSVERGGRSKPSYVKELEL